MGYVERGTNGEIVGWVMSPQSEQHSEEIADDDPELIAFMATTLAPLERAQFADAIAQYEAELE